MFRVPLVKGWNIKFYSGAKKSLHLLSGRSGSLRHGCGHARLHLSGGSSVAGGGGRVRSGVRLVVGRRLPVRDARRRHALLRREPRGHVRTHHGPPKLPPLPSGRQHQPECQEPHLRLPHRQVGTSLFNNLRH